MTGRVSAFLNYKVGFGRKPENFFKIFWWFFLIAAIGTSAINAFYWFCQWLVKKNSLSFLLKYFFGAVRFSCVATLWILFPLFSLVGRFKTVAGRGDKVLSLNSRANYSSNLMFSCFLSILFFFAPSPCWCHGQQISGFFVRDMVTFSVGGNGFIIFHTTR